MCVYLVVWQEVVRQVSLLSKGVVNRLEVALFHHIEGLQQHERDVKLDDTAAVIIQVSLYKMSTPSTSSKCCAAVTELMTDDVCVCVCSTVMSTQVGNISPPELTCTSL